MDLKKRVRNPSNLLATENDDSFLFVSLIFDHFKFLEMAVEYANKASNILSEDKELLEIYRETSTKLSLLSQSFYEASRNRFKLEVLKP